MCTHDRADSPEGSIGRAVCELQAMNRQVGSEVSRTGGRTRAPRETVPSRVLLLGVVAGLAAFAGSASAGSRSSFSFSISSGDSCGPRSSWGYSGYQSSYHGGSRGGYRGYDRGWSRPVYVAPCPPPRPVFVSRPVYVAPCPPPVIVTPPVCYDTPRVSVASYSTYSRGSSVRTFYGTGSSCDTDVVYARPATHAPHWRDWDSAPARVVENVTVVQQPVVERQSVVTYVGTPRTEERVIERTIVQQPVIEQKVEVTEVVAPPATVYRASNISGTMEQGVSPTQIVREIRSQAGESRSEKAEQFLGKTITQPWDVKFEGVQEVGGVREIRCRATEALENGYRPTILIRGAGDSKDPPKGFIGKAMGRIASVSVDDANYPGGVIIIDDGFVKW